MAFMDVDGAQRERNRSLAAASCLGCYSTAEPVSVGLGFYVEQFRFQKACSAANRRHRKAKILEKQKAFQSKPSSHQRFHPPHLLSQFSPRFKVVEEAAEAGKNLSFLMPDPAYRQPWKPREGFKSRDKRSSQRETQVTQDELQNLCALQPPATESGSLNFNRQFRPGRANSTSCSTGQEMTVMQALGQRGLPVDKFSGHVVSEVEDLCIDLSLCCGRQSIASSNQSLQTRSQGSFENREAKFVRTDSDHNSAQREVASGVDHRFCRQNEPCLALSLTCVGHGTEHCKRFQAKGAISCINSFGCVNLEPKPLRVSDTQGKNIYRAETSPDQAFDKRAGLVKRPKSHHQLTTDMPADAVQAASCSEASRSRLQFSFNDQNSGNDRPLTPPRSETLFKESSFVRRRILRRHGKKNRPTVVSENCGFYHRLLGSLGSSIPSKLDKSDENLPDYNINSSNDYDKDGKSGSLSKEEDTEAEAQPMANVKFMAPPLVRSKRGRSQNLPWRFSDSVLGSWKRETRQKPRTN